MVRGPGRGAVSKEEVKKAVVGGLDEDPEFFSGWGSSRRIRFVDGVVDLMMGGYGTWWKGGPPLVWVDEEGEVALPEGVPEGNPVFEMAVDSMRYATDDDSVTCRPIMLEETGHLPSWVDSGKRPYLVCCGDPHMPGWPGTACKVRLLTPEEARPWAPTRIPGRIVEVGGFELEL